VKITKATNKTSINITKLDFLKIGFSTGWIKKYSIDGEVVEIDGKFYKDENGKTVEVGEPGKKIEEKQSAKSITVENVTVPALNIQEDFTFTEGKLYENYYGTYRVKNINANDNSLDVVYVSIKHPTVSSDQVYNYKIRTQAEAVLSTRGRQQQEIRGLRGTLINPDLTIQRKKDEYFVIGYIAKNAYVSAEIGPKSIKTFAEQYEKITGEDPEKYLDKGYHLSPSARYSYTLRVKFPVPVNLNTQSKFNEFSRADAMITRGSSIEINSNEYIWKLFNIGFRINRNNQNIGNIFGNIPEEYREDFTSGTEAN